ncbi:glycosyltransferase family 4 protein [Haloarcula pelagica]|uniref:glycosyltransferase family 4 protein n=1 Tax=Haloarcula pelagica TaxID=3033389 RepID=UPI0024C34F78|nr:glycosyltransferase family 1 protein [Halomicroarcula sp. YJ-61-S]
MTDEPGGAVQTAKCLTQELIRRPDVETTLFGHQALSDEFGTDVESKGYLSRSQFFGVGWERTVLPLLARRHDIDILFCPNANAPLHRTPYPVVTYIHDVGAMHDWSSSVHGLYRKTTVPRVADVSDRIVTVSAFSRDEIVEQLGVDPARVNVVHNGINKRFLSDKPGEPIEVPDQFVLYVGALNPRKNVSGLVEAYRRVSDDFNHELVLTGPRNKELFDSFEIRETDDVHMTGFVSQEELKFLYDEADVFAYPSFYEGFGLPPLEAAACKTPVVTSRTGAIPDVLGNAARYVDPKDRADIGSALLWATRNPAAMKNTTAARQRVQSLTWKHAAKDLYSVLKEESRQ